MNEQPTVLAIDDVPANLKLLGQILSPQYRFLMATSGAAGLEVARVQRPDIILLDVVMPEMDGHAVCLALKGNPTTAHIPVIFITALKEETDETYGLEIGAIDYITKPFSPGIVKARVKNHLDLKRYRDLLEGLATTDGLTGIANRRHFDDALDREWRSADRRQAPLSLILMDIDFFKLYNDHYGHVQGDDCLRAVGQALANEPRRSTEFVARYGGEEFVCVLPDTDLDGARHVAHDLLTCVRSLQRPHEKSAAAPHVTLSLGVACIVPSAGTEPGELVRQADAALYAAKKNGRNQVSS